MGKNVFDKHDYDYLRKALIARHRSMPPVSYPKNHLRHHFNESYHKIRFLKSRMDINRPGFLKRFNYEMAEIQYKVKEQFYIKNHLDDALDYALTVEVRLGVLRDMSEVLAKAGKIRQNEIRPLMFKANRTPEEVKKIESFLEVMEKLNEHIKFLNQTFWHMDDKMLNRFCNQGLYGHTPLLAELSNQTMPKLDAPEYKAPYRYSPLETFAYYW